MLNSVINKYHANFRLAAERNYDMSSAHDNAGRHFFAFIEKNRSFHKILAKYAEMSDELLRVTDLISQKKSRGKEVHVEDYEDLEYYDTFCKWLAVTIADHALEEAGYNKDDEGYWI